MTSPALGTPEISVVIPTFNRSEAVTRALHSVLDQGYTGHEIVVVDDGSSDGTEARLAERFGDQIRFFRSEANRGGGWARNCGISEARGKLVCFLDSDDIYLPGKLQFVADFFARHPDTDVLIDSHRTADPQNPSRPGRAKINPDISDPMEFRRQAFFRTMLKSTPGISARREALLGVGMFDESLRRRQDIDLVLRLARKHRCRSTGTVLWEKHNSPDSISGKVSRHTFLKSAIELYKRHPEYLSEYRAALDSDLKHHFKRVVRSHDLAMLFRDVLAYKRCPMFTSPVWRLLLQREDRSVANRFVASEKRAEQLGGE